MIFRAFSLDNYYEEVSEIFRLVSRQQADLAVCVCLQHYLDCELVSACQCMLIIKYHDLLWLRSSMSLIDNPPRLFTRRIRF